MTARRQKLLMEKIRRSRARLMVRDPSLAMVLMYMRFVATKNDIGASNSWTWVNDPWPWEYKEVDL